MKTIIFLAAVFAFMPNYSKAQTCITLQEAAVLTLPYLPFKQPVGPGVKKGDGYYFPAAQVGNNVEGVFVSCSGEVAKMSCDPSDNCTKEKIEKCLSENQAYKKINHAIRGSQIDGKLVGGPERRGFNYIFFLSSVMQLNERRSATVSCQGEIKATLCPPSGPCENLPLKPWTTPKTVRDLRAIPGSWYYCQALRQDGHGTSPGTEMVIKVQGHPGLVHFGLVADPRSWICEACSYVKENPDGGLPLECDAPGMRVRER